MGAAVAGIQKIFSSRICSSENVTLLFAFAHKPWFLRHGSQNSANSRYCCTLLVVQYCSKSAIFGCRFIDETVVQESECKDVGAYFKENTWQAQYSKPVMGLGVVLVAKEG